MHKTLDDAREEDNDPVKGSLVQDRLGQRGPVIPSQIGHRIGDQDRLPDDECCNRGEHKAANGGRIIGEQEARRKHDEIEADKEEDGRRRRFARLV
jgi:hypothetical protein